MSNPQDSVKANDIVLVKGGPYELKLFAIEKIFPAGWVTARLLSNPDEFINLNPSRDPWEFVRGGTKYCAACDQRLPLWWFTKSEGPQLGRLRKVCHFCGDISRRDHGNYSRLYRAGLCRDVARNYERSL